MTYAADTSVSAEKSRAEIETILRRYGADSFASGWDAKGATIGFRCHERFIRFQLVLPRPDEKRFTERQDRNWRIPDGWCFAGATKTARWSQIGQAMPPGLAHAVAMSVRRALEDRK